jgi:hypothetical protein
MIIHCMDDVKRSEDRFKAWDDHVEKVRKSGKHSAAIKARAEIVNSTTGTVNSIRTNGRRLYGRGAREMFHERKFAAVCDNLRGQYEPEVLRFAHDTGLVSNS